MDHLHKAIILISFGLEIVPYTYAPKSIHRVGKQPIYPLICFKSVQTVFFLFAVELPHGVVSLSLSSDTTKKLMFSPKYKSVEVINNPARLRSNHRKINYINYKQQQQR